MENIKLKNIYDEVTKCKKCGIEYGYDVPKKYKKTIMGRTKIKPGYKDNGLCPKHDDAFKEKLNLKKFSDLKEKPKGLYTREN